ncbi:MAG: DUF4864 domain-containing protein [Rhodospirillales bacterium]|nr:DUF4864 domain-containing protein [Rhodospirillales bacterium]
MRVLVRLLGILSVLVVFAVGPAWAQTSDADRAAIAQVIQSQMAAFQKDDGPTAYGYASPTIQQKFVNPDIFLEMVKTGYPAVYHPREVQFRELKVENGRLLQEVFVVGPDGNPALAIYEMQRQPDGSWRINGCWLTRAPDQSV